MGWYEPGDGYFIPDESDPPEIRTKFGYEHLVVTHRARQWLRAAHPEWGDRLLESQVAGLYQAWANTLPSFQEICRRRSLRGEAEAEHAWLTGERAKGLDLTKPELEFLADHFEGANDPIAAAIWAKVRAALAA